MFEDIDDMSIWCGLYLIQDSDKKAADGIKGK